MSKWTSLCEISKTANEAKALAEQALRSGGTGIVVDGKPTEGSKNAVSSGGVYDAMNSLAIKGNKSGAAVACDVSPIEHTMRVKARGKNILSPNYYHATGRETNGITFTVDNNGVITANGEATGTAMFIMKYATNPVRLKTGEKYVLSGAPQGASVSTYYMTLSADDNSAFITDLGSGKAFTATRSSYTLIIYIEKGTKAENLIFKPQIEEGSTATAYAPYVADISTANVMQYGKNLINPSQMTTENETANNFANFVDNGDGSYTLIKKGTNGWKTKTFPVHIPANTPFSISAKILEQDAPFILGIIRTDDWYGRQLNRTYTEPKDIIGVFFYFQTSEADGTKATFCDVQLEIDGATEYEPYIEPTTYPISADGTVEGVKSLYPTTTLMADTESIVLDVEYNRDINNAFAELQSIVNTLVGG